MLDTLAPEVSDTLPEAEPPRRRIRKRTIFGSILAVLVFLFAWLSITAPLSQSLEPVAAPALLLLSAEGTPIARRGAVFDAPVRVSELPRHVPGAFTSIEDRRFYSHPGIDPIGITRALFTNIGAGGVRAGGSTITQQLAKLAFLDADRTLARKFRELFIAFWLEIWLTKDDILGRYLSSAYYGDNVYGLRAAARHYFNRTPEDLSIPQAAMLAGTVQAPSRLNPYANLKASQKRSRIVMAAMVDTGLIANARAPATPVARKVKMPTGTYFADWVFAKARIAADRQPGLRTLRTTLEAPLQKLAIRTLAPLKLGKAQVALISMRPDGRVVAMVGGRSYKTSQFNRATQGLRQPGSTFKLFVYLAALRAGLTPDTRISDTPLTIGDWSPRNSGGQYRGDIDLQRAFAVSSNVAAVRLSEQVGRASVIEAARDLGVTSKLAANPSIALGTSGVTLIEMTAAYAAAASGTYPVRPRGLVEPPKSWFERWTTGPKHLGDRKTWPMLLDLLYGATNAGTGRAAALRTPTFGKTGTSQGNRDAVYIGFADGLVTAIWVGNDDNTPLPDAMTGGGLPARVWRQYMSRAVATGLARDAERPAPYLSQIERDSGWGSFLGDELKSIKGVTEALSDLIGPATSQPEPERPREPEPPEPQPLPPREFPVPEEPAYLPPPEPEFEPEEPEQGYRRTRRPDDPPAEEEPF